MNILQPLKLLLPALLPSWNFFDIITPSPRIEFTLLNSEKKPISEWVEFRPRPKKLSFLQMLKRLLWNPKWNESLFLASCAERIMAHDTQSHVEHSKNEILKRIEYEIKHKLTTNREIAIYFQFRLLFVQRKNSQLQKEVTFLSQIKEIAMDVNE